MQASKNVLSLFSGCGGMDLGFEGEFEVLEASVNQKLHPTWIYKEVRPKWVKLKATCFKTIFANDIRTGARAAWIPYFRDIRGVRNADQIFHLESIVDLVKMAKNGGKNVFNHKVDVVTGGFPCQDFSVAGKRRGFTSHKSHTGDLLEGTDNPTHENRGMLYMWMREVINLIKPKVFVAENVKGLVSLANAKETIENDFRNIGSGYLVVPARVIKAAEYGIPQSRERVFFLGFHRSDLTTEALVALEKDSIPGEFDPYPQPTHVYLNGTAVQNHQLSFLDHSLSSSIKVREIFQDLPEPDRAMNDLSQQTYSKARWYGTHCQGQTEIDLNGVGPTIRSEHHGNIEYRRLSQDHGGKYLDELAEGMMERRLTIRECARLQTFPDDYEFVRKHSGISPEWRLSASESYKLIGNAVPPLLAYHIGSRLEELWPKLFKESK
ncbi:DNA (cytosine-5-)-methyltransferase [Deltaproteobacteria bacterium TL4]